MSGATYCDYEWVDPTKWWILNPAVMRRGPVPRTPIPAV